MRIYLITACVLGERVTLFYKPSTQRTVNEWYENNVPRLTEKGFSDFDVYDYKEDNF